MSYPNDPKNPWSYTTYRRLEDERPPHEPLDNRAKMAVGLGIASLVLWLCPCVGTMASVVAIVLGIMALMSDNPTSKIMGGVGIGLGAVSLVLSLVSNIVFVVLQANNP